MNRQKFIKLFSKKILGEIDAKDQDLLEKTIIEDDHYKDLAGHFEIYFSKSNLSLKSNSQHQLEQIWAKIDSNQNGHFNGKYNYSGNKSFVNSPIWIKAAAALIITSGLGILLYKFSKIETSHELQQLTTNDVKTFKILDDGTRVWLNKHSTLSYNKSFGADVREITIEGEAYFDVVKNNRIPLYVHAGNIDIEVKGTAFNVKAEKDRHDIEVSLVRGLIQVSDRLNKNSSLLLRPNQKIVYSTGQENKENNLLLKLVNPSTLLNETRWIADTLLFRKEKLKDLVRKMEKKYDVKIDIRSEALKEKHFSGIFINETIEQALTSLKLSYPLTYIINKRSIIIKEQE